VPQQLLHQLTIGANKLDIEKYNRKIIPNILLFCKTRWSAKYNSIRIFVVNFLIIVKALEELSKGTTNSNTKIKSYKLFTAATTPIFIVTLQVITVLSAKFEPVCNQIQ